MNLKNLFICCVCGISVAFGSGSTTHKLNPEILAKSTCDLQLMSWKVVASNAIEQCDDRSFIKNTKYHNSILNVIGKAIVDCLNQRNEFADLENKSVIKFANQNYSEYTVSNYNAVVLYNLVAAVLNKKFRKNIADCFNIYDLEDFITKQYDLKNKDELKKLHKACSDIFEYDKELHIIDTLERYNKPCSYFDETKYKPIRNTDMYYSYIEKNRYRGFIVPDIYLEKPETVYNKYDNENTCVEIKPAVEPLLGYNSKEGWKIASITLKDITQDVTTTCYIDEETTTEKMRTRLYIDKDNLIDKINKRLKMIGLTCIRSIIEGAIKKEIYLNSYSNDIK